MDGTPEDWSAHRRDGQVSRIASNVASKPGVGSAAGADGGGVAGPGGGGCGCGVTLGGGASDAQPPTTHTATTIHLETMSREG